MEFASVRVYNKLDTTKVVSGTYTANNGTFTINVMKGEYRLLFTSLGYKAKSLDLDLTYWNEEVYPVDPLVLEEDKRLLADIFVDARRMEQNIDKLDITFSDEQKASAKEARDLMLSIPHLLIDKISNTLASSDGKPVLILINGIRSNDSELKLIPANKVKRVEYYDIPPIRYGVSGSVINITTENLDSGWAGDFYLTATQFYSMFTPYVSFINGRHKFTLGSDLLVNPKRSVKDHYEGKYTYSLRGKDHEYGYQREEQNWGNNGNFSMAYTNYKENKYVFQAKAVIGFLADNYDETRNVTYTVDTIQDTKKGVLTNRNKSFFPSLDLYYSRKFSESRELNLNLVSAIFTNQQDLFSEEKGLYPFKDAMNNDNQKKTTIGEINYVTNIGKNNFSFGYRTNISSADNTISNILTGEKDLTDKIYLQEHYLYGETSGNLNKISYRVSLGGKLNTTETSGTSFNQKQFTPVLILGYPLNMRNYIRLHYQSSTGVPQIQQLSGNSIMVLNNIVRKGNPDLKSSQSHEIKLYHTYSGKIINTKIALYFEKDNNYIFDYYQQEVINNQNYITLSNVNAVKNQRYGIESNLSLKPIKGLRVGCNFKAYKQTFQPTATSAEISKYFYPVTLYASYQYKNLSFDYYQKLSSSFLDGINVSGIEKVSYLSAGYSYKDWIVQLTYYFPFVKNTFRSYTIVDSMVSSYYQGWLKSKEKTFGLSVSWRFSTSRKEYNADKNISNEVDDKGTFDVK
ncbi:MAG: TonB-dependent receptor [Bacteroidales bacterium]|nr:TonB-dependent receptor [Bacteroidales bacterium]